MRCSVQLQGDNAAHLLQAAERRKPHHHPHPPEVNHASKTWSYGQLLGGGGKWGVRVQFMSGLQDKIHELLRFCIIPKFNEWESCLPPVQRFLSKEVVHLSSSRSSALCFYCICCTGQVKLSSCCSVFQVSACDNKTTRLSGTFTRAGFTVYRAA